MASITQGQPSFGSFLTGGSVIIPLAQTQVPEVFSSPLISDNVEVFIKDPNGTGWKEIVDVTKNGFKITGIRPGTLIYLAFVKS